MKKTRFQSLVLMAIDATQPTTHKLYRKNNSNQCFFGSFDNENNDTPGFVTSCLCGRFIATIQAVNIMCIFEKHSGSSVSEPTIFNFLKSLKFLIDNFCDTHLLPPAKPANGPRGIDFLSSTTKASRIIVYFISE